MKKIIVNVPTDLVDALEARREDTGCSVSEYIRRTARKALEEEQRIAVTQPTMESSDDE